MLIPRKNTSILPSNLDLVFRPPIPRGVGWQRFVARPFTVQTVHEHISCIEFRLGPCDQLFSRGWELADTCREAVQSCLPSGQRTNTAIAHRNLTDSVHHLVQRSAERPSESSHPLERTHKYRTELLCCRWSCDRGRPGER